VGAAIRPGACTGESGPAKNGLLFAVVSGSPLFFLGSWPMVGCVFLMMPGPTLDGYVAVRSLATACRSGAEFCFLHW
jgi:hypothetical protein